MTTTTTINDQMAAQKFARHQGSCDHWTLVAGSLVAVINRREGYIANASDYAGDYDDSSAIARLAFRSFHGVGKKVGDLLREHAEGELSDAAYALAQFKRGQDPRKAKRAPARRVALNFKQVDLTTGREYVAVHGEVAFIIADWRERDWLTGELIPDGDGSFCCFILDRRVLAAGAFQLSEPNERANYMSWSAAKGFCERAAIKGDDLLDDDERDYAEQLLLEDGVKIYA